MIVKTNSTFGNFSIEAQAEVTQEQLVALGNNGLLQLLQRSPSSAAEKVLAGYEKRPAGFKRDSIPFSEKGSTMLATELEKPIKLGENIPDLTASVVVSQYVPTAGDVKMADERAAYARHKDDLKEFATKIGYDGEVGDGTAENAPVEYLRAIRAYVKSELAKL